MQIPHVYTIQNILWIEGMIPREPEDGKLEYKISITIYVRTLYLKTFVLLDVLFCDLNHIVAINKTII